MNNVQKIGYLASGAALVSSFFIKDNAKAVKRRYLALAIFGGVWAYELVVRKKTA